MVIKKILGFAIVMDKSPYLCDGGIEEKPIPQIVNCDYDRKSAEAYGRDEIINEWLGGTEVQDEITIFNCKGNADEACDILNARYGKEGYHYSVKSIKVTYSI